MEVQRRLATTGIPVVFFTANDDPAIREKTLEAGATGYLQKPFDKDTCIGPIKPENIDAWLDPDSKNLAALHVILDDRDRSYYEHRLAV